MPANTFSPILQKIRQFRILTFIELDAVTPRLLKPSTCLPPNTSGAFFFLSI
jgi:hypothetical protein